MSILQNIVGKLWMTIISLVAVVLIILGLFLYRYIDTNFPKLGEQQRDLEQLAFRIVDELSDRSHDSSYFAAMNDVLDAQSIGMQYLRSPSGTSEEALLMSDILTPLEQQQALQGVVIQKRFFASAEDGNKEEYLAIAIPVTGPDNDEVTGSVVMYQPIKSSESLQDYVKRLFALASFMGFLLTTFFAFFLITRLTKPLKQLRQAANLITQGQYSTRVYVGSHDELGELARTFNLMAEQLEETIKLLNNEKANLSRVLRSMSDAVISFDTKHKVIFANPQGETILKEWGEIMWNDPDPEGGAANSIPEPLQLLFDEVIQETKVVTTKLHVRQGVWSVVMAPLYSHKRARGAVAVLRDVTEEHRLEKLRKDFVANVSHELRTPLSMLQGYSEALLDDIAGTPEEKHDLAQVIYDESLRMGRLVKDLLDLARMEAGHMEMNLGPVELAPLFRRVHRKFLALCKEKDIRLECVPPPDEVVLQKADQDRLEQVFTNLLGNAIRHTMPGKAIYLRYQTLTYQDTSAALIEVEDEGEGIPPEDIPYIFERFYKADKARLRGATVGTGLGLAIVKNIVEAHQGSVNVRSIVGQGTTFSVILPLDP
ncbi:ATP-binding protein [Paenibacillus sp. YN15]|uniref:ATP-binding protein n=1 Tax=Paenibacillus sp. YN15 TaxID=1742774 RepID=UPI000DCB143D|nr:ATP-binding protein [Paenibacillus sp. YN15]RAV03625.1 two-component sensor histidine kinase [Paenibacillus sp. YN15]